MEKCYSLGIDLGTTNTCFGVWESDNVEILVNDYKNRTTPSVVSVYTHISKNKSESESESEIVVGEEAVENINVDPENTVDNVKRMMGRLFNDKEIQSDMKHWLFKVVEKENKRPYIRLKFRNKIKYYSPEEISSLILLKVKEIAEDYLGHKVTGAVITVPAYFNDAQRRATKIAGEMAGFKVQRIVNEPTAAAIAYGFKKVKSKGKTNILVVDIGGGTLDVSLLTINNGRYQVRATAGETHLGGEDFDNRLVNYFVKDFKENYNIDITADARVMRRLKLSCENAKRKLSSSLSATLFLYSFYDNIDYCPGISRSTFEELNKDLFEKVLEPINTVIEDSGISKSNIQEIILVGGSSRIPKIQELISKFFDGKKLSRNINPDEAVATGAAILSASLSGVDSDKLRYLKLFDVTPISIGFRTSGGVMRKVIKRNTRIPTTETEYYTTKLDYQTKIKIQVYEGENHFIRDNNLLGKFWLTNIPPAPHGVPKIQQTISIDENGILNVSALDTSTGNSNEITIVSNDNSLSSEEIEQIIRNVEKYEEEKRKEKARIKAKNNFERSAFELRSSLNTSSIRSKIESNEYDSLLNYINSIIKWSKNYPNAKQEEYEKKILLLDNIKNKINRKIRNYK
ncbi:hsp71-like protein [Neocallimastix californiae]|uniref:Hsp71-like protein n=1 Tax=Neocallimastix californiae TaxID=1754190 RepID=A0A1Y2D820_9FUNG|nr:hsp71-like protein [Neocallimastix californiae]|eukprot:ORY55409.1 hsp71-like protein [Neocallimastix californiae]